MMTSHYSIISLVFITTSFTNFAYAESEQESETKQKRPTYGVIFNPLIPVILNSLQNGDELKEAKIIGLGANDYNIRVHHMFDQKMGVTIQLEYSQLSIFTKTTYVGIRSGPRFSIKKQGLIDWSIMPFTILGRNVVSAGTYSLASWATIGFGAEMNYTWFWGDALMEIGLGMYKTHNIGYTIYTDSLAPQWLTT